MPYEYDVVLSFAGEQRTYVAEVALILRRQGLRVFYDDFEDIALWGKDLHDHLAHVYRDAAKYCIMFVSKDYGEKMWPNHERKSAMERALEQRSGEYLLPVRFDDTELPGLGLRAFLDLRQLSPMEFARKTAEKVTGQPFVEALETRVSLTPPYEPPYPETPTDQISIQHAVRTIARQSGLQYAFQESLASIGDAAQNWINPELNSVPAGDALRRVLEPYGLFFHVHAGVLSLTRATAQQWSEIARWEGKERKETEIFTVEGECRIRWTKRAARGWNFRIRLFQPGLDRPVETLVNENVREASGETYVHRSGRFYMKIEPRQPQDHWQVVVEQKR